MENPKSLQHTFYEDFRDREFFQMAINSGLEYMEGVFDRNVFPTQVAINRLKVLDEEMPQYPSRASDVIQLLSEYGPPATVAQLGGRYFGFVCGSAVPAGLAAKTLATFWDQNAAMHVLSPITSKLNILLKEPASISFS